MARYNTKCFSAIYTQAIRDLRGRTSDATLLESVKDWINDAQDIVTSEYKWPFLEVRLSGAMVVGVGVYPFPSGTNAINFVDPIDIVIWNPTPKVYTQLMIETVKEIDAWFPGLSATGTSAARGMPKKAYMFGTYSWYPQPVPNSAYTYQIRYHKKVSRMAATSAISQVPWPLLQNYAMWQGCLYQAAGEKATQFKQHFYALLQYYYLRIVERNDQLFEIERKIKEGVVNGQI